MTTATAPPDASAYRPDIDGLRAVAVLSVILFHIDESLLPGGFVGVDIFFVISGYLISLHILRDIDSQRFSIIEFYRRRVKRIAPAMLVVIAVTMLTTQILFRPPDAELVAESALWSLLSLANVYFWLHQDTSYFAAASSELPLLHLWSLGVEEQFYIFWPLLLMLFYRASRSAHFALACVVLGAGSFVLGDLLYARDPSFVYYMLPTRAGELLVGAVTAQIVLLFGTTAISARTVSVGALIGTVLVGASLALLSEDQIFPGWRAVPPTIGTALLILCGHFGNAWPSRILRLRPMVWVGLISYSAYLWHWPLLAVYRYGKAEIDLLAGATLFSLTLLLAWLSYLYVERPMRHTTRPALQVFARQYIVPAGTLALVAVVCMKIDGYGLRWLSPDYQGRLTALRDETRPAHVHDYICQSQLLRPEDATNPSCIVGAESGEPPRAILWGDSNATHFVGLLGVFAREGGFRFRNLAIDACPPINADPVRFVTARRLSNCRDSLPIAWQAVREYDAVIISASWAGYQSRSPQFLDVFFDTVRTLASKGKQIILLGKVPIISTYDRLCREKALSFPFMQCSAPSVALSREVAVPNERLRSFAARTPNVEYYDINEHLCPAGACSALEPNGTPIYYDQSHLSLPGSWRIGDAIHRNGGIPFPFTLLTRQSPHANLPSNTASAKR